MKLREITIKGNPYELGFQHGSQTKSAIHENVRFYFDLWKYFSGIERDRIIKDTQKFIPYIEKYDAELTEELRGVAEGSDLPFEEIVALNCRWELNYAYIPIFSAGIGPMGCTAFALTPEVTKNKHTFVGQNWDYKPQLEKTCIILRIKQEKKPHIIMHTEAGIIGHKGFNSAGIGVCLNYIRCEKDVFKPGFPVWIKIRKILNANSFSECIKIIMNFKQANSANIIIAHQDGEVIDVECTPDDTFFLYPKRGILTHTNHFLHPNFREKDTGKELLPDTVIRSYRSFRIFKEKSGSLDFPEIENLLKDHFGSPDSICRHRNERVNLNEQWETLTSMVIDLNEGKMQFTAGPPCCHEYENISI